MDACMRRIDPFFPAPMAAGGLCDLRFAYADELAERERAFDAMMTMKKIDIAAIEAAHRG